MRLALFGIRGSSRTRYGCELSIMSLPHRTLKPLHRSRSKHSAIQFLLLSFPAGNCCFPSFLHQSNMFNRIPCWILTIVATLLAITTFSLYAASHFYRDPGSIFFRPALAFERSYSVQRELQATAFLKSRHPDEYGNHGASLHGATSPSLCAVVVHSPRGLDASIRTAEVSLLQNLWVQLTY